jgi:hypothetical protein
VEPPIQYVRAVDGTAHPGAEHAFWSSVVSDVLSAVGPAVTEAPDARARVFVPPPGIVRLVVVLDHVLRMSTGGFLEGGMHAERLQAVVLRNVVVQSEQPLLPGVQEDLTPSAPAGIASTRHLCRRVYCARPAAARRMATKTTSGYLMNTLPLSLFQHFNQSALQHFSFLFSLVDECASCARSIPLHIALYVSLCVVSGQGHIPAPCWRHRLLRSLLLAAGSVRGASLYGLGQDALGGEGHLLCGDAGCQLARVAGNHDHEIGVSSVARLRGRQSRRRQRWFRSSRSCARPASLPAEAGAGGLRRKYSS